MARINIVLFSYKNKQLKDTVDNIYKTSHLKDFSITVFDQNNVNRRDSFDAFENLEYVFVLWDSIQSPCQRKSHEIQESDSEFMMIMSDDTWLTPGWDERLLGFSQDKDVVVSGRGIAKVSYKNIYTIVNNPEPANDFHISQYIDRNLIFGRTATLQAVRYPRKLKYHGEEEMLSIRLMAADIDIYSAPGDIYSDLGQRTIETTYSIFSKYHNFNNVFGAIQSGKADRFLEYHKLDKDFYKPVPDLINDVEYDLNRDNYFTDSARKFVERVDGINYEGMVK